VIAFYSDEVDGTAAKEEVVDNSTSVLVFAGGTVVEGAAAGATGADARVGSFHGGCTGCKLNELGGISGSYIVSLINLRK
jgi:hypothetical protein